MVRFSSDAGSVDLLARLDGLGPAVADIFYERNEGNTVYAGSGWMVGEGSRKYTPSLSVSFVSEGDELHITNTASERLFGYFEQGYA